MSIAAATDMCTEGTVVERRIDGTIQRKAYYREGKCHRDGDRPAATNYAADGVTRRTEYYYREGKYHRDGDRPAAINYAANGTTVTFEEYWRDDKLHRAGDQPAAIQYTQGGDTRAQEWYFHEGDLHRAGGRPASIQYYTRDGVTRTIEEYWLRNVQKTKKEAVMRWAPQVHADVSPLGAAVLSAFVHGLRRLQWPGGASKASETEPVVHVDPAAIEYMLEQVFPAEWW